MRRIVVLSVLAVVFAIGAAFSYHNPQAVDLNYLAGTLQAPLGAVLTAAIAVTVAVLVLVYAVLSVPRRAELARLRRRLDKAETELSRLRSLPLKDG